MTDEQMIAEIEAAVREEGQLCLSAKHATRLLALAKAGMRLPKVEAELAEWLSDAMMSESYLIPNGELKGWWGSMGSSSVCATGDRLVELGLWERHPDGKGHRQFYRPIEAAAAARAAEQERE